MVPLAAARIPPAAHESSFQPNVPRSKRSPSHLPPNAGKARWEWSPLGVLVGIRSHHYREMCHSTVVTIPLGIHSCNAKTDYKLRRIKGGEAQIEEHTSYYKCSRTVQMFYKQSRGKLYLTQQKNICC